MVLVKKNFFEPSILTNTLFIHPSILTNSAWPKLRDFWSFYLNLKPLLLKRVLYKDQTFCHLRFRTSVSSSQSKWWPDPPSMLPTSTTNAKSIPSSLLRSSAQLTASPPSKFPRQTFKENELWRSMKACGSNSCIHQAGLLLGQDTFIIDVMLFWLSFPSVNRTRVGTDRVNFCYDIWCCSLGVAPSQVTSGRGDSKKSHKKTWCYIYTPSMPVCLIENLVCHLLKRVHF